MMAAARACMRNNMAVGKQRVLFYYTELLSCSFNDGKPTHDAGQSMPRPFQNIITCSNLTSVAEHVSILPLAGQLSLKNIFLFQKGFGGVSQAIAALSSKFRTSRRTEHAKTFPKHHHMQQSDIGSRTYVNSSISRTTFAQKYFFSISKRIWGRISSNSGPFFKIPNITPDRTC